MTEKIYRKWAVAFTAAICGVVMLFPQGGLASGEDAQQMIAEGNAMLFEELSDEDLTEAIEYGNIFLFFGGSSDAADDGGFSVDASAQEEGASSSQDEQQDNTEQQTTQEDLGSGKIMGSDVKLRAEANTTSNVNFLLSDGAEVQIDAQENDWYKVTYGIVEGYVRNDFLFLAQDGGRNGIITQDGVIVRQSPSQSAAAVETVSAGYNVQVTGYEEGYFLIQHSGKTGYIQRGQLRLGGSFTGESDSPTLTVGMSGQEVVKLQNELIRRGFMSGEATGDYGEITRNAVLDFQKAAKLTADGSAGPQTLKMLYDSSNGIAKTISEKSQVKGKVQMVEWSKMNKIFARGMTAKYIDVRTGLTWSERRLGGWLHADVEPVTAQDTANLKKAYGGKWSWDRRPVWVIINNQVYAASINGMPHGGESISGNNFNGHHCTHFLKSKTHGGRKVCPKHQACIREAYNAGK